MSENQAELSFSSPPSADAWADFLIATRPGMTAERHALWRATLAAGSVEPVAYLGLTPKRREKVAPLPEGAEKSLEQRLPEWRRLTHRGGVGEELWLVRPDDDGWPAEALDPLGRNAPRHLLGWGNQGLLASALVGIVGSRAAPPDMLQTAEILARSLVELGMGIVSGGARGVDETAHRTSLGNGGSTVFALPEGLLISPQFETRADLDPARVCLVSAVWPWQRWSTAEALARNRVIVALGQALVVVAAESKSGSLMTGRTALDLERPLLVVDPPEITVHNAGNRILIQLGGTPLSVTEGHAPNDLRQALGLAAAPRPRPGDLFEGVDHE